MFAKAQRHSEILVIIWPKIYSTYWLVKKKAKAFLPVD